MKVSVVILNWERPKILYKIVTKLSEYDNVGEIIIAHGKENLKNINIHKVRNLRLSNNKYGLFMRFIAAKKARYELILFQDDDMYIPESTINQLIKFSQAQPKRIHGIYGRTIKNGYETLQTNYGEVPIVLTKVSMFPKYMNQHFINYKNLVDNWVKKNAIPYWNGEDIYMSLLTTALSGNMNVAHNLIRGQSPASFDGISSDPNHKRYRSELINKLLEVLPESQRTLRDSNYYTVFNPADYVYNVIRYVLYVLKKKSSNLRIKDVKYSRK